jgi:hypothetical protein
MRPVSLEMKSRTYRAGTGVLLSAILLARAWNGNTSKTFSAYAGRLAACCRTLPRDGQGLRGRSRCRYPSRMLGISGTDPVRLGLSIKANSRRNSSVDDGNWRKIRFWRWWPGVFLNQPQLASDAGARPPRASAVSPLAEPPNAGDGTCRSRERGPPSRAPIDTGGWARRPPAVCRQLGVASDNERSPLA